MGKANGEVTEVTWDHKGQIWTRPIWHKRLARELAPSLTGLIERVSETAALEVECAPTDAGQFE